MLTISAFILATASILTSVWWACKSEEAAPVPDPSDIAPA
jgi:hypothetical protein